MATSPLQAKRGQLAAAAHIPVTAEDIAACAAVAYMVVVADRIAAGSVAEDKHRAIGILAAEAGIDWEDTDQAGTIQEGTDREACSRAINQGSRVAFQKLYY